MSRSSQSIPPDILAIAKIKYWQKVITRSGCWGWGGAIHPDGYAILPIKGKPLKAHRVSFALNKGELIPGMVIDHLCGVRSCTNPKHLEQVTPSENHSWERTSGRIVF